MGKKKVQGMAELRVMISGGGTGGHIFPAIAIAEAMENLWKEEIRFLFVGAKGKMEMKRVPSAGYPIEGLWISGFQRRWTWKNLLFPVKLMISLIKANRLLKRFRPHLVIGTGGYASGPLLYTASRKGIPSLIQEQNSFPGITNRILAKHVDRICVAYEGMEAYFPSNKLVLTGNPVRASIRDTEASRDSASREFDLDPARKTLLVLGGSLGARTINESIGAAIPDFLEQGIQVLWQTGKSGYEDALAVAEKQDHRNLRVQAFIERMDLAYRTADLVVARAGALTVSELSHLHMAVIFIPSPNVAEDHQSRNARSLVEKGAARMIRDEDARNRLKETILDLMAQDEKRKKMRERMKELAPKDASLEIARCALEIRGVPGSMEESKAS